MANGEQVPRKEPSPRLHEVTEFCANTTAHGLGRVAAATSWPARIFWISIFATASIYAAYQISASLREFLDYPTKTEVTLENREKLIFPAVTVCNLNPLKLSNLINTSVWKNIVSILHFVHCSCYVANQSEGVYLERSENY